jgi:predicted RNA-binding Zn ribbon-like protein
MMKTDNDYLSKGFGQQFVWLDLVNSQEWDGFGKPIDHLAKTPWLGMFLRYWNLARRVPRRVPQAKIVRLRALLRRIAENLAAGGSLDRKEVAALNAVLNVPACEKVFQRQNGFRSALVPVRPGWAWILSRIAASLTKMVAGNRLDRLKICPNTGCRWIFYDRTKGNTRRWCHDRTCGNRDRVRRARAAQKNRKRAARKRPRGA